MRQDLTEQKDVHAQSVKHFDGQIKDKMEQTLWKIKDCEDLLKTRISEQKVDDIIEKLDTKFNLEIKNKNLKMMN